MIRPLTPADIPAGQALATAHGWTAEAHKWRLLLEVGDGYGWQDADGTLCGCVVVTRFGGVAVVGTLLVAPGRGGQGIGGALMRHALEAVSAADSVFLHATAAGRPLYEKLGFRCVDDLVTYAGPWSPVGSGTTVRVTATDEVVTTLDAEAVGYSRTALLRRLPAFAEQIRVAHDDAGRALGYAAAWDNTVWTAIGPVVAPDGAVARALVTDLASSAEGPVRVDLLARTEPPLHAWLTANGLTEIMRATLMVRGDDLPPGNGSYLAPLMQSLG